MTPAVLAALVVAAVAVAGSVGSVLMLAVRVGVLIGTVNSSQTSAAEDRRHLWEEMGRQAGRQERHVELYHGSTVVSH